MKTVPYFLRGPFRTVLRIALRQIQSIDMVERKRGWKLFLLAHRMLLHRPPRGCLISKEKLASRFSKFARGEWMDLVNMGARCAVQLVQLGELSSARQALEGAELAPGNELTLYELHNLARRQDVLRDPIPEDIMNMAPHEFELDEMFFLRTLRSSRKGAAGGPSGMANEHLRPPPRFCERQSFVVLGQGAICQGQRSSSSCLYDSTREDDSTPEGTLEASGASWPATL